MRMVLPKPGQHARMHLAFEIVHDKGTEDRDFVLMGEPVELIFEAHAGRYVSLLPKNIHHLAPPTNFRIAACTARLRDDIPSEPQKYRRLRHSVPHKRGQQFIRVDDRELPVTHRGFYVYAFGLEAGPKRVPVRSRGHENDTFTVGDRARS